jgi:pimeloyl-ACP methyl ester carboxylesterase
VLAVAIVLAWRSGNEPAVDTVAAVEQELGIDLESTRVPTNGIVLHVVQAGPKDGPPVVLLHGFPEFWYGWRRQIGPLARAGFRVIVPDQRGYGASDKPPDIASYRLDLPARDVAELVTALGYQSVFLAGHDWGGAVAWRVALDHPERVRRLVIFNLPHPQAFADAMREGTARPRGYWLFFQLPWLPELGNRLAHWRALIQGLRDSARPGTFTDDELPHYRYAWDRDGAMRTMLHWYRAAMRVQPPEPPRWQVDLPVRLVLAPHDAFIETATVRRSLAYCGNATAVEIPNVGHWLLHEEPERTSREMIEFFGGDATERPGS